MMPNKRYLVTIPARNELKVIVYCGTDDPRKVMDLAIAKATRTKPKIEWEFDEGSYNCAEPGEWIKEVKQ